VRSVAQGVKATGSTLVSGLKDRLKDGVSKAKETLGKGVEDTKTRMSEHTQKVGSKARETPAQSSAKIAAGKSKVEAEAHKEPKKHGGPFGFVMNAVDWVKEKLKAAFKFVAKLITDPGFWVSLVVFVAIVALAPVTGGASLAALALVGAVAGAVSSGAGQIVSNLAAGKKWNESLGMAMLLGGVGGAVLGPAGGRIAAAVGRTALGGALKSGAQRAVAAAGRTALGGALRPGARRVVSAGERAVRAVGKGARAGAKALGKGARASATAIGRGGRRAIVAGGRAAKSVGQKLRDKLGKLKVKQGKTNRNPRRDPVEDPKAEPPKAEPPKAEPPKAEPPKEQWVPCFVAVTLVDLGGDTCPIEAVSPGDLVLGRPADDGEDEDEDRDGIFRVTTVHRSRTSRIVRLRAGGDILVCTPRHPFSVAGRGWVAAADLRADDVLDGRSGSTTTLTAIEHVRLLEEAATFNFEVQTASTYFVRIGERSVLVHNGGPDPFDFDRILYWLLGPKPKLAPDDVDGLSTWKTSSRDEVVRLMETRVNVENRSPTKAVHSFYTPEQLESAGIKPVKTPGEGPLAEHRFEHNSLRPAELPVGDPLPPLTAEQMGTLREKLSEAGETARVKPNQLKCG